MLERLRDEHGFTGGYTIVKDYMRERERRGREMFVPLAHPPGHAQADFGEAIVIIGEVERKAHFFVMDLPHSDACYVRAYPAATAEAWVDGHVHAFAFFGKVPVSTLYDNDRCLVSKILPDGTRQRATLFSGFLSHYLFRDRYGRPGKGNDKGNVEGLVGYSRRNFMVPVPRFATWDAFNAHLEERCRRRQTDVLRGQTETIGQRLARDLAVMPELPAAPFDACDQTTGRVNSQALVRYKTNDYSVPVAYGQGACDPRRERPHAIRADPCANAGAAEGAALRADRRGDVADPHPQGHPVGRGTAATGRYALRRRLVPQERLHLHRRHRRRPASHLDRRHLRHIPAPPRRAQNTPGPPHPHGRCTLLRGVTRKVELRLSEGSLSLIALQSSAGQRDARADRRTAAARD